MAGGQGVDGSLLRPEPFSAQRPLPSEHASTDVRFWEQDGSCASWLGPPYLTIPTMKRYTGTRAFSGQGGQPLAPAAAASCGWERPLGHLEEERPGRLPDVSVLPWPCVGHGSVADTIEQARRSELVS
jgi:hypothetical protein